MKRVVLTPEAQRDISDIWEYIAADSPAAADRVIGSIEEALYRLADTPGIGHVRDDLADNRHRFYLVHSYLIVFRHRTDPLQVLRVLHAARDVRSIIAFPLSDEG